MNCRLIRDIPRLGCCLYALIENLFKESFFVDGVVPTSNFREALLAKTGQTTSHLATRQRQAARAASQGAVDIHGLLDLNLNSWFNKKSNLILYRMVDWNPDAISDNDVGFGTMLFFKRLENRRLMSTRRPMSLASKTRSLFAVRRRLG